MIWIAAAVPLFAQVPAENPTTACKSTNQPDAATVGQYKFTAYKSSHGACVQATSGGKVVYKHSVVSPGLETFILGQPADSQYNIAALANGTDVTGRGRPDMIVSLFFAGPAHCCGVHYVFELEPKFRLLATLKDPDGLGQFARSGADPRYYYIATDWNSGYWPSCLTCSKSELVTLRWVDDDKGGGFQLAMDKMQKPAPTPAEWDKALWEAQDVANEGYDVDFIEATMWQTVLDLIYTGHSDLAWKLVDAAGPKAQQSPFPSLADFCSVLKTSPYWPDLQPTLKNTPPACANAKPQQSN